MFGLRQIVLGECLNTIVFLFFCMRLKFKKMIGVEIVENLKFSIFQTVLFIYVPFGTVTSPRTFRPSRTTSTSAPVSDKRSVFDFDPTLNSTSTAT